MLPVVLTTLAFFTPTPSVPLSRGGRATLVGSGPPVLFSSGLFGTMPRQLYADLFRKLSPNVTLVVVENGLSPLSAADVEDASNALGVETIGFLAHSSFDASALESPRLRSAVLCDPVTLPQFNVATLGVESQRVDSTCPILVLRAGLAYEGAAIPEFLMPAADNVATKTFPGMGHADVLDDVWADLGARTLPWMGEVRTEQVPFSDWQFHKRATSADRKRIRAEYRAAIADAAVEHLLRVQYLPCA